MQKIKIYIEHSRSSIYNGLLMDQSAMSSDSSAMQKLLSKNIAVSTPNVLNKVIIDSIPST